MPGSVFLFSTIVVQGFVLVVANLPDGCQDAQSIQESGSCTEALDTPGQATPSLFQKRRLAFHYAEGSDDIAAISENADSEVKANAATAAAKAPAIAASAAPAAEAGETSPSHSAVRLEQVPPHLLDASNSSLTTGGGSFAALPFERSLSLLNVATDHVLGFTKSTSAGMLAVSIGVGVLIMVTIICMVLGLILYAFQSDWHDTSDRSAAIDACRQPRQSLLTASGDARASGGCSPAIVSRLSLAECKRPSLPKPLQGFPDALASPVGATTGPSAGAMSSAAGSSFDLSSNGRRPAVNTLHHICPDFVVPFDSECLVFVPGRPADVAANIVFVTDQQDRPIFRAVFDDRPTKNVSLMSVHHDAVFGRAQLSNGTAHIYEGPAMPNVADHSPFAEVRCEYGLDGVAKFAVTTRSYGYQLHVTGNWRWQDTQLRDPQTRVLALVSQGVAADDPLNRRVRIGPLADVVFVLLTFLSFDMLQE